MSKENVDVIRRGFDHYAATGDQLWENYSDAVVVRDQQSPDQAEYRGLDGVRRWIADWSAAWDDWQIEVEEIVEAGESVLALIHHTGRGHASGLEMDSHDAMLFTLDHGKVVALDYFHDRERALAAAQAAAQAATRY
jgi:ketosteroid isomerase-like protein